MHDDNKRYDIIYLGELTPDTDPEIAISEFAKLAKTTKQVARKLITGDSRVIKQNIAAEQLTSYTSALERIGLLFEIEARPTPDSIEPTVFISEPSNSATQVYGARTYQFEFLGTTSEYFKIWIVNIFLTIVTLGLYSPWAKVRNTQYFYSNTLLDDCGFNYTANPIALLKGRLIAVALFAIYTLSSQFYPLVAGILALLFIPAMPWLIIKSVAFNARNSLYRNVAFNFSGRYGEAFKVYILLPLLIVFTLGLIIPYLWYRKQKFHVERSAYGTSYFKYQAQVGEFWHFLLIALAILFGAGVISAILSFVSDWPFIGAAIMAMAYFYIAGYIFTAMINIQYNRSTLNDIHFNSALTPRAMIWIYATNTLAILVSLGLLIPWAKIRLAQYRASCLSLTTNTSLDQFIAAESREVSALGEQMGEVFDMDIPII